MIVLNLTFLTEDNLSIPMDSILTMLCLNQSVFLIHINDLNHGAGSNLEN